MNEGSFSPTPRIADHIEVMQNLLQEILHIQKENTDVDKGMQRVQEIIVESSRVVENSTSPNEMIVDARILHTGTTVVNSNVSSLNTNLTSFSEPRYIRGIQTFIENSDQVVVVGKEWQCLAPLTYNMFKKSHTFKFMLGPFNLEPPPPRQKAKGVRQRRAPEPEKTFLATVEQNEGPEREGSDVYDHILKWLVRRYKRNDRKPIKYFNFIVNPDNYWKTVENIFYCAFLVRDGSVKMAMVEGIPYIEPVLRSAEDKNLKPTTNYQFCFSLSFEDWEKLVRKHDISKPSIPIFKARTQN